MKKRMEAGRENTGKYMKERLMWGVSGGTYRGRVEEQEGS